MKQKIFCILFVFLFVLLSCIELEAQCPMCRMAVESNQQNGGTQAQGLNNGILYLLMTPYLLIGSLAFIWYRNRKKNLEEA